MKLTLKKILALVAGGLAVIAFIMAFLSPLKSEMGSAVVNAEAADIWFEDGGTIIPFIAFIVALLAGAYLIVRQFISIPKDNTIFWVAIGLLVAAAVVIFLTETFYIGSQIAYLKDLGAPATYLETAKTSMAEALGLGIGTLLGGILAALSAVCAVVSEKFIKD